jgi:Uma2 family endonuclease
MQAFQSDPPRLPGACATAASGGLDKLAIYQGLGVPEVWFWQDEGFRLLVLRGDQYEPAACSSLLPGLDFARLAEFVRREDQPAAVAEWRSALTGR